MPYIFFYEEKKISKYFPVCSFMCSFQPSTLCMTRLIDEKVVIKYFWSFFYFDDQIFSQLSSPTPSVHSIKLVETHLWPRSHTGNFLFEKIQRISHRTRPLLYHLFSQKRVSRTNQDSKGIKWISWYYALQYTHPSITEWISLPMDTIMTI